MTGVPGAVHTACMELRLAYGAGLLSLINPCVVPVLPIVIATALQADRLGPVAMAAGLSVSFVTLGVGIAAFGPAIGLDLYTIQQAAAVLMIVFGIALLVPRAVGVMGLATAGIAARADAGIDQIDRAACVASFWVGCCWAPSGALASAQPWAVRFHWQAKAKACCVPRPS